MNTISESTLQYINNGGYQKVTLTVYTIDNVTFEIKNEDIASGSFNIDKNTISNSTFEIGNVEASELTFTVLGPYNKFVDYKFEGAEVHVEFDINNEIINGGIYYIDNKPTKSASFQIKALDKIIKFSKKYVSNLGATATVSDVITEAGNKCNVVMVIPNTLVNLDYIVNVPHDIDTTYHEVLCWCAQLTCSNGFMNNDNYFQLGWYGEQQPTGQTIPIDTSTRFELQSNEKDVVITGVAYNDGTSPEVAFGTSDTILDLEFNPLIRGGTVSTCIQNIFTKINGFTYRPYKGSIIANLQFEVMDIVQNTTLSGEIFTSIISNWNYTLNGKLKLEARGKTGQESGYAVNKSQFTPKQLSSIRNYASKEAEQSLSNYETAVLNATTAINENRGFYETKVVDEFGKITEYYQHDKPLLSNSLVVTKITEGYVGKSTDGGQTYTTTISAYGATIPQLTTRLIFADQITLGTETLPSVIEGLQDDVAGIVTGSQNLLFNSTWGSFETPASDFWEENITWQFLEKRNASWNAIETSATNWNVFESGDW